MNQDLMVFILEITYLKKVKDGPYVINLNEYADVGTHWIALLCKKSEIFYFDNFDVEHVPEKNKKFIDYKNIKANIFRVQASNSLMCGYFCIRFIDLMLAGKTLILLVCFLLMTFKKMTV